MASTTTAVPQIPPAPFIPQLTALLFLTSQQFQRKLKNTAIAIEPSTSKSELQALWTLLKLGFLECSGKPAPEDLQQVKKWWEVKTEDLSLELQNRGLRDSSNKVNCVQVLVQDRLAVHLKIPRPEAMNLPIDLVYAKHTHSSEASFPQYPLHLAPTLRSDLESLPRFRTPHELKNELSTQRYESQGLLQWLISEDVFECELAPANETLLIPEMPDNRQLFRSFSMSILKSTTGYLCYFSTVQGNKTYSQSYKTGFPSPTKTLKGPASGCPNTPGYLFHR
ncbi:hypothetical protein G7Y89_g1685 [Cudoniella acicularis]|uniref:Uncharacterized protein n=1 Tax=Cudoniella acicularis TaxID=354080 RepID=A0A8H4RWK7_9HELO|nr:hypothetical protein G7Y89_g1685 [Cudoniella acicularis]